MPKGGAQNVPQLEVTVIRNKIFKDPQNAHIESPGHFQPPREIRKILSIKLRPWRYLKHDHL